MLNLHSRHPTHLPHFPHPTGEIKPSAINMLDESDDLPVIVIDGGSGTFKAGFAGDDGPQTMFQSIVGSHRETVFQNTGVSDSDTNKEKFVGEEINGKEHNWLSLQYPIEHGVVTNWDDFELLCAHSFQQLHADPEEHGVLMSHPPLNPLANKERMMELIYEAFNIPAFYLADTSQLNLYSSGRGCGIVIDIGDGITSAVPYYDSYVFNDAIQRQDFGGRDLTFYLQRLLHEKGYSFTTTSELQQVRQMMEGQGYVASDYTVALNSKQSPENVPYTLPDGNKVALDKEKFQCTEALFDPSLSGYPNLKGLPDLIDTSLSMCGSDVLPNICVSCLITGGCSLFPGFKNRLKAELEKRWPPRRKINVVPIVSSIQSVWVGGSILGSMSMFQPMLVSKQDYFEKGPSLASNIFERR